MFDDNQEPKDMFADVSDAVPKRENVQPPQVSQVISPEQAVQYEHVPKTPGIGRAMVMVVISLACIGTAGYAAYRFMVRDAVPQQVADVLDEETPPLEKEETVPAQEREASSSSPKNDKEERGDGPTAVVDSDGDGLSNDEEREAGTSVAKPDTDGDGLGDREEVKVYGTDPKQADTDGDSYRDGDEVKNGYNPNGEGKLLQIPEE